VAVAHHAHLFKESMGMDPEFNGAILHAAGYNIREAVKEAIKRGILGLQVKPNAVLLTIVQLFETGGSRTC